MPRFKNTGLAPVTVGDGVPVAPGEIVELDEDASGLLTQVPEPAKTKRSAPAAKENDQ